MHNRTVRIYGVGVHGWRAFYETANKGAVVSMKEHVS